MRNDLDDLMAARDLAALLLPVDEIYSPTLDYLVGPIAITGGLAIKPVGAEPTLFVNGMEVEEAAASGVTVYTLADMDWHTLRAEHASTDEAEVALWGRCLAHLGITLGKVGVYGTGTLHRYTALVDHFRATYPQYTLTGEMGRTLFDEAFLTKDDAALERIRRVAAGTNAVMQATWEYIASHILRDENLMRPDGMPLTIGDVRRFINKALLDYDLEDTGMIFAQGRDGAFPHSRGTDTEPLRAGVPIVFDLFPRERGGGYHHDMTRTWCIGHAPPEVEELYDTVMGAFDVALAQFSVGSPTHAMQTAVQDYFEARDHPTSRSNPGTAEGYVHSLGHGVGLEIHEKPLISHLSKDDTFTVGNVITIEPGLYYPSRAAGVRVEDTFYVTPDGTLQSLSMFTKALVLPVKDGHDNSQ